MTLLRGVLADAWAAAAADDDQDGGGELHAGPSAARLLASEAIRRSGGKGKQSGRGGRSSGNVDSPR